MIDNDSNSRFENLVRGAAPSAFDAGFADRVLIGVRSSREQPLSAALERQFVRIVPLAAAASLLLAAYNWWGAHDTTRNALDAALNLPQVTVATAYSPASLGVGGLAGSENP